MTASVHAGQSGVMTDENREPATASGPRRFSDQLIRPFVLTTITGITLVELIVRPPARFGWAIWALTVVVIAVAALSCLSWRAWPVRAQAGLTWLFMIAGALLFALAPASAGVAFVFVAAATAGEKLTSTRAAFVIVGAGMVLTTAATWFAASELHLAGEASWWLALTVGLPLYVGIARRERAEALAVAEFAARETRRAAASEAREAALEERGRIAREIHDVLGHSLSGIAIQLDMADALHTGGRDDEANEAVLRARALALSGFGETRRAIHALREDTLPLPQTIEKLAESGNAGFALAGEPGVVRVEVAQAVIRTAQEAITNAHRHARGGTVALRLEYSETLIRLTVTDTGGTAAATGPGSGMGLVGMRERASLLGGTLHAGPVDPPARGWTVRLELPR